MFRLLLLLTFISLSLLMSESWSADVPPNRIPADSGSFPKKPITIYTAATSNGEITLVAPLLARFLERYLGTKVNVSFSTTKKIEDGVKEFMKLPSDGYSLMIMSQNSIVLPRPDQADYEHFWHKLHYIEIFVSQPRICYVAKNSPIKDLPHLMELIRKNPGSIRHVTFGSRGAKYLPAYLLRQYGLRYDQISHVAGKAGDSIPTMIANGHGDFSCASPSSVIPDIKNNLVRPIYINSPQPLPGFPNLNYPLNSKQSNQFRLQYWWALISAKKLPSNVEAKIKSALLKISQDKEWQESDTVKYSVNSIGRIQDPYAFVKEEAAFYENLGVLLSFVK